MQKKILILERALPIDEQNSVCIASQTSAATTRNYYCKALQSADMVSKHVYDQIVYSLILATSILLNRS